MDKGSLDLTYWVVSSTALHIASFIAVSLHALQRRRNASATILWIFVAWSFPAFGPLLYLSFGIDRVSTKGMKKKIANETVMHQRDQRHHDSSPFKAWHLSYRSCMTDIEDSLSRTLHRSIDALNPDHPLLDANAITPLISGDEAYPRMLQAIRAAKNHIHLQSFIIHGDATGRKFMEALREKADEGVRIRLMFDRFGSTHAYLGRMFRTYRKVPNFEICGWTQANPFKAQFQINLRNHRKCLIVDGHTAFYGGVNISNANTTSSGRSAIRDYHFMVEGPLVHELQLSFLRDWYFMTNHPMDTLLNAEHFPEMLSIGKARARLIDSGPSETPGMIGETFFNAMIMAREQILLVTPYFVPTVDILKALRSAAHRGVDVRIVLPKKNNHRYAGLASRALYEELLLSGVRIFERQPPFIHAKAMIIDSRIAVTGTANLDTRSLELNYETTVLFEDEYAVNQLKRIVNEDIEKSAELDLNTWIRRSSFHKLAENLCSLMTPVL